ncbi:hypothetical protein ACTHAM_001182 [Cellulomonas soli]|uniref:hypothetical protein n=1 Tax=Cellulomonas soli TaxID=931535 RepID=UPI003F828507
MAHDRLEPVLRRALDDLAVTSRRVHVAQQLRWQGDAADSYHSSIADALVGLASLRAAVEAAVRPVAAFDVAQAQATAFTGGSAPTTSSASDVLGACRG